MAIIDLIGTTWLFNSTINFLSDAYYSITFNTNNQSCNNIVFTDQHELSYYLGNSWITAYTQGQGWSNEAYRTVEFTGGSSAINQTFITWVEANAVQQVPTTSIALGSTTLTGVNTLKLVDGTDDTKYQEFKFGTTATTTTNVKLSNDTLTGVGTLSVSSGSNSNVSFGLAPSAYNYSITAVESGSSLSYKTFLKIYDGVDDTGTLLVNSTTQSNMPQTTFTCTTGHLYIVNCSSLGGHYGTVSLSNVVGNVTTIKSEYEDYICKIDGNCSFTIDTNYNYD